MKAARTVRIPNSPILVGNRWRFANGRYVPVIAGGATDEPVVVPEDLTAVEDADLEAFENGLEAEFNELIDAGSKDLPALKAIGDTIKRVRAERQVRLDQDAADAAEVDALKAEILGDPAPADDADGGDGGDGGGDDPGAGDPAGDAGGSGATADEKDPALVAAGLPRRTNRGKPAKASTTSRNSQRPAVPARDGNLLTLTAAADVPGLSGGQTVDLEQVAVAMHDKARQLANGSPRVPVARLTTLFAAGEMITKGDSAEAALAKIDALADPRRRGFRDAAALVAAGGWCTPSQNSYDLLALDSQSGLLDVPKVGIERGGLNIPGYIGIDAADGALWHWSEGQDAQPTITITDLDVASGVGTATNSGTNLLLVGDMVELAMSNVLMNGPHTVTAVADATHFTLNMTGVADATNATGVASRQKGCFEIPCPVWTDNRLEAYGLCLRNGNLTDKAFPELTKRYASLVINSHMHRMSAINIAKIRAASNSDAVTVTAIGTDSFGELMSAIELSAEDFRSQYKIGDSVIIECLLPDWTREMLRANLSMRAGVDLTTVSDAELLAAFNARNVRTQFLEDYQPLWNGSARVVWPSSIEFVIYAAGTFVEGTGGTIDLGVLRDSRLNATNDFTAAWTEDFDLLARRGPKARKVTATLTTDGITACCP